MIIIIIIIINNNNNNTINTSNNKNTITHPQPETSPPSSKLHDNSGNTRCRTIVGTGSLPR